VTKRVTVTVSMVKSSKQSGSTLFYFVVLQTIARVVIKHCVCDCAYTLYILYVFAYYKPHLN